MRKLINVTDLYVQCALKTRNLPVPGTVMSDCCQNSATSAVQMADGSAMWRCGEHKGVRSVDALGNVLEYGNVITMVALNRKES